MFDHNPNLDRWGNAMEFINGVAAGAVNPFLSAGEAVGLGDALYGTGYAIDKATMYGIAPLSADGKLSAIGGLGKLGGAEKDIGNAVRDWSAENPNAAETVEAAFNAAAFAKAAKLAKTGVGKAAVSDNFADAYSVKQQLKTQFGNNPNQIYHTFRHTDKLGLDRDIVQKEVTSHLAKVANQVTEGKPFNAVIKVQGKDIQYTAFKLKDGTYNIGRIHGAPKKTID